MNATYVIGLAESTYQQLVYGHSLKNLGAFGLNISLMQGGKIILDNVDDTEREVESQSDLAVTAGYGIALNKNPGLGFALKTLNRYSPGPNRTTFRRFSSAKRRHGNQV